MLNKKWLLTLIAILALLLTLVACSSSDTSDETTADEPVAEETTDDETMAEDQSDDAAMEEESSGSAMDSEAAMVADEFFSQEQYDRSMRQMTMQAEGPADQPWIQMLEPEMIDTSEYAKEGPYTFCFSNAGVNNPCSALSATRPCWQKSICILKSKNSSMSTLKGVTKNRFLTLLTSLPVATATS